MISLEKRAQTYMIIFVKKTLRGAFLHTSLTHQAAGLFYRNYHLTGLSFQEIDWKLKGPQQEIASCILRPFPKRIICLIDALTTSKRHRFIITHPKVLAGKLNQIIY